MIDVGINACRNRSGGAKVHLIGLLKGADPLSFGIRKVHVWSYRDLLEMLPDVPWIIKHNPLSLEQSLIHQLWWERHVLPKEARRHNCAILLNTSAGSVCRFHPSVVMSRDMLCFEPEEMKRFGVSLGRARLIALKSVQANSMRRADGVIFLTKYAAQTIQETTGEIDRYTVIPHGVGDGFRKSAARKVWPNDAGEEIRCLYVSNALPYKHQWNVIKAIGVLREWGHNVSLLLAGGGTGRAQALLEREKQRVDPGGDFIEQIDFVAHESIPDLIAQADVFVFASSCENMPNTLVEAMAGGIPIASSDRGPMPEVLQDGGEYFDPEKPETIARAIEKIVNDQELRKSIAERAIELSKRYRWETCASDTWEFLRTMVDEYES